MKTFRIPRNILIIGLLFFLMVSLLMTYLYLVEKNRNSNMMLYDNSSLIRTDGTPISKDEKDKMYKDAQEKALADSILTMSGINEASIKIFNANPDDETKVILIIETEKNFSISKELISSIRTIISKSIENLKKENITIITQDGNIEDY